MSDLLNAERELSLHSKVPQSSHNLQISRLRCPQSSFTASTSPPFPPWPLVICLPLPVCANWSPNCHLLETFSTLVFFSVLTSLTSEEGCPPLVTHSLLTSCKTASAHPTLFILKWISKQSSINTPSPSILVSITSLNPIPRAPVNPTAPS